MQALTLANEIVLCHKITSIYSKIKIADLAHTRKCSIATRPFSIWEGGVWASVHLTSIDVKSEASIFLKEAAWFAAMMYSRKYVGLYTASHIRYKKKSFWKVVQLIVEYVTSLVRDHHLEQTHLHEDLWSRGMINQHDNAVISVCLLHTHVAWKRQLQLSWLTCQW